MEQGLRIIDDFTSASVFRAREDTPWRPDAKRASLDALCPDCRALETDGYCPEHELHPLADALPERGTVEVMGPPLGALTEPPPAAPQFTPQTFTLSGGASGTTA